MKAVALRIPNQSAARTSQSGRARRRVCAYRAAFGSIVCASAAGSGVYVPTRAYARECVVGARPLQQGTECSATEAVYYLITTDQATAFE